MKSKKSKSPELSPICARIEALEQAQALERLESLQKRVDDLEIDRDQLENEVSGSEGEMALLKNVLKNQGISVE